MFPPLPTKGAPVISAKQEIKLTPSSQSIADLVRALKPGEVFKPPTKRPSGSAENTQDNTSESENDKEVLAVSAEPPTKEVKPIARNRRHTDDSSRGESIGFERKTKVNRGSWSHPALTKAGSSTPGMSE